MSDEFYIGWQATAPRRIARTIRLAVVSLVCLAVVAAMLMAFSQRLIGNGVFEWGNVRAFSGTLKASPVPHLIVSQGVTNRVHYLVRPWKYGFDPELAAKYDGQQVTLRGTLIYRDHQTMIEVEPRSLTGGGSGENESLRVHSLNSESLGKQTFIGEIVDSKCFLGVMNPGQLKPHRACAVRCISGGVPPILLVRETNGDVRYLLLVSRNGKPVNKQVLNIVAEPVRITGEVVRQGDLLVLHADPSTYRRVW